MDEMGDGKGREGKRGASCVGGKPQRDRYKEDKCSMHDSSGFDRRG